MVNSMKSFKNLIIQLNLWSRNSVWWLESVLLFFIAYFLKVPFFTDIRNNMRPWVLLDLASYLSLNLFRFRPREVRPNRLLHQLLVGRATALFLDLSQSAWNVVLTLTGVMLQILVLWAHLVCNLWLVLLLEEGIV